ncbi:MAG: hypothetical protein RMK75_07620 [Aquificaceae bacterium]|nr:hypothetical protein [Aquificaceae bacterium]MDW8032409.1 hypothetical protein [Aquificaceae bacterium]MDW8424167.1 hypothetical protein [Aquificaceae bacterium]
MIHLLIFALFSFAFSHDVEHSISREGSCVVVSFYFPDGSAFSYEGYEVFYEGEKVPFQVGRSDALGRVVFCPNRAGFWLVKIRSEDGHGAEVRLKAEGERLEVDRGIVDRNIKLLAGLGILLGIFGLFEIYVRRFRR